MPTSDFLLDTNAAIALLNGDQAIREKFPASSKAMLSIVVLAELLYGAQKSQRRQINLQRIDAFSGMLPLLVCGRTTAGVFARIRNELRVIGKPIPTNDLWIAATAMENNLTLISRDAHFEHMHGLRRIDW